MNIINTLKVDLVFNNNKLFDDINISIKKGEKVLLDGTVGSGKSAFMKMLSGLIEPTKGIITFDDEAFIYTMDKKFFQQRNKISYLLEGLEPLANISVFENVALYYRMNTHFSEKQIQEIVMDKLEKVGLTEKHDKRPSALSMEEKTTLAIIMNIKENSKLFVLDEIFAFLTMSTKKKLKELLLKIIDNKEITVLMTKTDNDILEIDFNRYLLIRKGKIIFDEVKHDNKI